MRVKNLAVIAAAALLLSGCSASPGTTDDGLVHVVASTNVYGDLAKTIGGTRVKVVSIIDDPAQDPHSYEGSARVQLALSQADVVIENGGGYDDFVGKLLASAGGDGVTVLNAAKISGYATSGEFNEHLWYDFPTMQKVVTSITAAFSKEDPAHETVFTANAATLLMGLTSLENDEAAIKAASGGAGVAITEPVPLYLLQACGLVNRTPAAFSKAIEDGTDVSPVVLKDTIALFTSHGVRLLAYNEQTTGPQTEQVLAAAKTAGVAVVPVTETMPAGRDYLSWMTANLAAVKAALQ